MNKLKMLFFASFAVAATLAGQAYADPINLPPPPGWILSLDGQPLPLSGYVQYSVDFVATDASTNITFALRDDPAFIYLDNIFVANSNDLGTNLILNGGFEGGGSGNSATDWTYLNQYGAAFGGELDCSGGGQGGSNCAWYDGAVQAYDAISQAIDTTVGDTYHISFWAYENSGGVFGDNWSALATNGGTGTSGNGINITVYAGAIPPPTGVPEPAALGMFGLGALLIGLFAGLRRRFD